MRMQRVARGTVAVHMTADAARIRLFDGDGDVLLQKRLGVGHVHAVASVAKGLLGLVTDETAGGIGQRLVAVHGPEVNGVRDGNAVALGAEVRWVTCLAGILITHPMRLTPLGTMRNLPWSVRAHALALRAIVAGVALRWRAFLGVALVAVIHHWPRDPSDRAAMGDRRMTSVAARVPGADIVLDPKAIAGGCRLQHGLMAGEARAPACGPSRS